MEARPESSSQPALSRRNDIAIDVNETDDSISEDSSIPSLVSEGSTEEEILYARLSAAEITAASDETWGIGGLDHFLRTPIWDRAPDAYSDSQQRKTEEVNLRRPESQAAQNLAKHSVTFNMRETEFRTPESTVEGLNDSQVEGFMSCRNRKPTPVHRPEAPPAQIHPKRSVAFNFLQNEFHTPDNNLDGLSDSEVEAFMSCRNRKPTPVHDSGDQSAQKQNHPKRSVAFNFLQTEFHTPENNLDGLNDSQVEQYMSCRNRKPTPVHHPEDQSAQNQPKRSVAFNFLQNEFHTPENHLAGLSDSEVEQFMSCRNRKATPVHDAGDQSAQSHPKRSVAFNFQQTEFYTPENSLDGLNDSQVEPFMSCRSRMPTPVHRLEDPAVPKRSVAFNIPQTEFYTPENNLDGLKDSEVESFMRCRNRKPTPPRRPVKSKSAWKNPKKRSVAFNSLTTVFHTPPDNNLGGRPESQLEPFKSCRKRKPTPARTWRPFISDEVPWKTKGWVKPKAGNAGDDREASESEAEDEVRRRRWPLYRDQAQGDTSFYIGFYTATLVVVLGLMAVVYSIYNNKFDSSPTPQPPL